MTRITKILESTLSAGATTVAFTDADIPNSLIRLYSSDPDLMPVSQSITNNTLTITYEPQSHVKYIAVELVKEGLDVIDDLTSEDDANALSAKQGYVLKGLIDNIQSASSLSELNDVLITSPSADNILVYDAIDQKWKNSVMPEMTTSLSELDDVDITNIQDGQVIAWNATAQKFVNVNQSGGGGGAGFPDFSNQIYASGLISSNFDQYTKTVDSNCWLMGIARGNGSQASQIKINDVIAIQNILNGDVSSMLPLKTGDVITLRNISSANYYINLFGIR